MPSWLIAVLRVLGIQRATDVIPVGRELVEQVREVVDPPEPGQPLSHADVRHIQSQIASATRPPNQAQDREPSARVVAASAPAAGAVREAPGAGAAGTRGRAPPRREPRPTVAKAVDRTAITPRAIPPRPAPRKEPKE